MMPATAIDRPDRGRGSGDGERRAARLIAAASIEISARDDIARDGLRELLPPGTPMFVNHGATVTHHDIVAACVRLRSAGFVPVPHIAARRLASFTQARDFLRRAASEAGVTRVMLTGGDPAQPIGPFADASQLLETGLVEGSGIVHATFAGYPEGHPRIDRRSLHQALHAKLALARQHGLEAALVTQFGFAAPPIRRWVAARREEGITCPIQIGIAGPATIATLAKFAVRCGIGASLPALGRGQTAFARILTEATPDDLIASLLASRLGGGTIDGLHFYALGGVRQTAMWMQSRSRRATR